MSWPLKNITNRRNMPQILSPNKKCKRQQRYSSNFTWKTWNSASRFNATFYARGYQFGWLSHLEMPIWLIQRYLAARARGTFPATDTPAAPAQRL